MILLSYHDDIGISEMTKRKGTIVYLSDGTKKKLEDLAKKWEVSQSSAMQRLIMEHEERGGSSR